MSLSCFSVSATVVEIPDFGNILLDAGEGTLGQLKRRYGSSLWTDILSKTKILYISHMHADHHLGVRRILEERMKVSLAALFTSSQRSPS
jgi:ribonuclease Z